MAPIKTICVYCGSGFGANPSFVDAAAELGQLMAESGVNLVYGGGNVGLMGTVARSVLAHGGSVTGIIPDFLKAASACSTTSRRPSSSPTCIRASV